MLSIALKELGDRVGIISAEDAWGLPYESLSYIRDQIESQGHQIHAVTYVRPPKSFMESAFQQRVKAGQGLSEFDRLDRVYPRYARLSTIRDVFVDHLCHIIPFKEGYLFGGDVVLDFCARICLDPKSITLQRVNESLSLLAVKLLYAYRAEYGPEPPGPDSIRRNNMMVRILRPFVCGQRLTFSHDILQDYLSSRPRDVEAFKSALGEVSSELLVSELTLGKGQISRESDLFELRPFEIEIINCCLEESLPDYRSRSCKSALDYSCDLKSLLESHWYRLNERRTKQHRP